MSNVTDYDNYGHPFVSEGARAEFEKREADPVYSLEVSKTEYKETVRALNSLTANHGLSGFEEAVKFSEKARELLDAVDAKLEQVQFDIQRVGEQSNPGWYEATTYNHRRVVPYSRMGRSRSTGRIGYRNFLIGEKRPEPMEDDGQD